MQLPTTMAKAPTSLNDSTVDVSVCAGVAPHLAAKWSMTLPLAWVTSVAVACTPAQPRLHSGHASSPGVEAEPSPSAPEPTKKAAERMTQYQNPVLPGTHPDPSVCRVGDDYYLAVSSFEYFPGVPIFHSRDLVHWRPIGHALTRESQLPLAGARSSQGIYAPTLRYHAGTFYLVTTRMKGGGSFYVTAHDPAGPWSEPIRIRDTPFTMDPSLFFDDDGKVYYTRHGEGPSGAIFQAEIDIATGVLKAEPQRIWSGTGGIWPEGPHVYRLGGYYYLLIAEGGTSYGHSITVARSRSPWGPFETNPGNPIVSHSNQPQRPIQAVGHGDLVQTASGAWWIMLLGIRPSTPGYHHIGREVFLAPVEWESQGWPVVNQGRGIELEMSGPGLPAAHPWPELPARESLQGGPLRLSWSYLRNPDPSRYSLSERSGFLRLKGSRVSLDDEASPTLIVQPQRSLRAHIATELQFEPQAGQSAGLVIRGNEKNHYALLIQSAGVPNSSRLISKSHDGSAPSRPGRSVVLLTTIDGATVEVARRPLAAGPVALSADGDLDHYEFFYQQPGGEPTSLGQAPTTAFAYEKTGSFTGAFVGIYAHSALEGRAAIADFAWFEYKPI